MSEENKIKSFLKNNTWVYLVTVFVVLITISIMST